jgi:putative hemolysin
LKLTSNSSRFFSTIQIGVTLAGFLSSAAAAQSFSDMLAGALSFLPLPQQTIDGISTFLITLILSYFSLVFGELVPKKIAMKRAEALSFRFAGVLTGIAAVFRPIVSLLTASTNAVVKLLGIDPRDTEQTITEEEILMMVDAGEEKGVLDEDAKDMISNIFDFSDSTVNEIMTHRTEVDAVEDTATIQDAVELSIKTGHSRISGLSR